MIGAVEVPASGSQEKASSGRDLARTGKLTSWEKEEGFELGGLGQWEDGDLETPRESMREKARSSKDATIRGRTRSLSGCTITQLVDMTDAAIPAEGVGKKYWSCKCTLHLHLTLDDATIPSEILSMNQTKIKFHTTTRSAHIIVSADSSPNPREP
ncbi:hypothetical protein M747DRAFT_300492 [Aspergillus niger ATCC 13496]|uniref:Uncharacterized protein n=1 Tax=Aspergillus niger ATCC 13496 TaxID=1353008 RepID=A0A370CGM5_ASPNG|nr:hypothetical protein M747DRAFT_300492 [Aspergillus niger ATCC 13496]